MQSWGAMPFHDLELRGSLRSFLMDPDGDDWNRYHGGEGKIEPFSEEREAGTMSKTYAWCAAWSERLQFVTLGNNTS